ncbi:MAG: cysteine--tRNA ligase [Bradyrhizobiaceae bacterium]|nr:MAG: cysteine--tRNA ligase [Bradyrhizobiaceae bacterium]
MELKLYDTLTKEKRAFVPLDASNVRMYVCGPTVYDFAHIGNARPVIVFDVLFRLLRHLYGEKHVTYVRNITDVDDKINDRAARDFPGLPLNEAIRKVTEQTEKQFHADVDELGCLRPSAEPRATEHIGEMRAIIEKLIANKNAYVEQDHVLFSVATDQKYGSLARRTLDEMLAGARVDVAPYKRAPMDFVLWKPSKPGEPSWPSPAGIGAPGRPGWHIECSAMADKLLWEDVKATLSSGQNYPHQFDIHGGGIDLVFPHHENEMAQSCCAFHQSRMANVWMHNGFLQVEGEKMSKSLGNFVTINELLTMDTFGKKTWAGNVVRVAMLKTHYRQPIDWTIKRLWEAEDQVVQWELLVDRIIEPLNNPSLMLKVGEPDREVMEALADDLNTHRALDRVHHLANEVRREPERLPFLISTLRLLGIEFSRPYGSNPANARRRDLMEKVGPLIMARESARARKDFAESDRIRDQLAAMGIAIKDGKDADGKPVTTWEVAR